MTSINLRGRTGAFLIALTILLSALFGSALGGARDAGAANLWYNAGCYKFAGEKCWSGGGYQNFKKVKTRIDDWHVTAGSVCAKGVRLDNGELKNGSGCNSNTTYRFSSFNEDSPKSSVFGYWGGGGGNGGRLSLTVWGCLAEVSDGNCTPPYPTTLGENSITTVRG